MRKIRASIILIVVVILVALTAAIVLTSSKSTDTAYRTVKIERGDISVVVTATGTLSAVTTVQVGSQVSGTIAKLFVDFNSQVKKGQFVAVIDTTFLETQVEDAEASLEKARIQTNQTLRDYSRTQDLFNKNLVSQADFDAAKTNYEAARANLKSAQAALNRAKINLKYATILAPIDGVVISRNVDVGQTVAASLQAPTLFIIAEDLTKMQVQANIDEADIGKVHVGQEVRFTVDAYADQQFIGTVSQIRLQPNIIQNVVNYTVIINVPNPDLKLMPGMTTTITILVDHREGVLKLPNMALRFQPSQKELEAVRQSFSSDTTRKSGVDSSRWSDRRNQGQQQGERRGEGGGQSGSQAGFDGRSGGFGANRSRIWILDEKRKLKMGFVKLGLNDGTNSEIAGNVKEAEEVVVGIATENTGPTAQRNPFSPQQQPGRRF